MIKSDPYRQDFAALETLFKRFYKPLCAYAFRFVNDKETAEDIVQDAFYELWSRRDTIRFGTEVKSYLFQTVYHRSLKVLEKRSAEKKDALGPENEGKILENYLAAQVQNTEQSLLLKELENEIATFIVTLPGQCRKIFMLSRFHELKNKEIADRLGISVKAVEKQITKALFGLRRYLREKGLFCLTFGAGAALLFF